MALGAKRPSLALRLAGTFAAALLVFSAVIAFVLDNAVLRGIERDLELATEAEVRHLLRLLSDEDDPAAAVRERARQLAHGGARVVIRVRRDGEVVAASPDGLNFPPAELPDGWAYAQVDARDRAGRAYAVEAVGQRSELERFVSRFRTNMVLLVTPLLVGAMIAAYALVRRALAPLDDVTAAAARIGSRTLGERLDAGRAPAEVARLVASFNDMLDRLEDAFRRMEEFGADLAHEIRTPVQNLRGEAEVALLRARSPDEYREVLGGIVEECERLARIVDDVLLLSRAERREEALDVAPFDLAAEIESVREYWGDVAEGRGIALVARSGGPLPLSGDRAKLRRAIANLVDNALKYTAPGGRVEIEARRAALAPDAIEVVVADTGPGIAPEHLPRLFERFYRVEKSRSRAFGGAGLGLGISRTLVRAHGGDVTIESELGKGTRARIVLPAARPISDSGH